MPDPTALEQKAEAKAEALAQSAAAKEQVLNSGASTLEMPTGAGYAPLDMQQFSGSGYAPLDVKEVPAGPKVDPSSVQANIPDREQPVTKITEDVWQNMDGSYTYFDKDGTKWRSENIEGLKSSMQAADIYQRDKNKSDNGVIDTVKGVGEVATNLAIDVGKGFVYASPTGLEEYLNSYNMKNNDTAGSEFYDVANNPIKDVKALASQYAEVTAAQKAGQELTPEQQAFLNSEEYKIADEGQKAVDETYKTLASMDEAKVDWSRKLDNFYAEKAYRTVRERDGTAAAIADAFDNPLYFVKTGIESVPYMVALTIGGPVTQTAMLTMIARGNAATNTQEFRKINGREPTAEEQFYIDAYSSVSTVAEKFADQALLGRLKWGNKVTGDLAGKLPASLQWLGGKALAIGGEGFSGATTETLNQLAIHGKIVDPTAIEYGAVTEAAASPSGAGTIVAGSVAKDVIIDEISKERFTKGNIDQKIADNQAELDKVAPTLTEQEIELRNSQLEKVNAWLDSDEAAKPKNAQAKANKEAQRKRIETQLALGRKINFDQETNDIDEATKPLLQRADLLENNKQRIEEGGLVTKLKQVPEKAKEAINKTQQDVEALNTAVDTAPEITPVTETATPTEGASVVLDPKQEGYDPFSAVESLVAELKKLQIGSKEAEDLKVDIGQHLEIALSYAYNPNTPQDKQDIAQQRLSSVSNTIIEYTPDTEPDTAQAQDNFLDIATPLDNTETKNSLDPNDVVQPMTAAESEALANEWLAAVNSEALATGQDAIIPATRDTTAGVDNGNLGVPSPRKTTEVVTKDFLNNPNYQEQQSKTGERRPGLAQLINGITSANTATELKARIKYLRNFKDKHLAKLAVFRAAQQAFADSKGTQAQTIYNTRDGGFSFGPKLAKGEALPAGAVSVAFDVSGFGGINKIVANLNAEANALVNAVDRANKYEAPRTEELNRRTANRLAEVTGKETPNQRAARRAKEAQPKPDQTDRGDAATPAPAEQSGAADPIVSALTNIVQAVRSGQMTQEQANIAIAALTASQSNAQTETTTPAATEAATVDQTAVPVDTTGTVDTQAQEAPQTPETATPAQAETTAAPVQEEQATTPEETVVDDAPINTKAAFIAKYSQYIAEGTKKLVPFEELPAEVLAQMAADIGACK